jgi:hypothetical protein
VKALALALAAVAVAAPLAAQPVVAVTEFSFTDTSGETDDQTEVHAARLTLFAETLRRDLALTGRADVVVPTCDPAPCRPGQSAVSTLTAAAQSAGASLMLYGGLQKVSTLIGKIEVRLLDVDAGEVVCQRALTYRGDTDRAWTNAAGYVAEDVAASCLR